MAALGSAGGIVDPAAVTVDFAGLRVWCDGQPQPYDPKAAEAALAGREVEIVVDLGRGKACATAWTCDLTEDYVRENAGYEGPAREQGR